MSSLRRRFTVAWDDRDPVEVITNARDVAAVTVYLPKTINEDGDTVISDDAQNSPDSMWRLVHAALLRCELPGVPTDYDQWVDVLDECNPLDQGARDGATPGPTMPAVSGMPR